jgi:hypothetical protein
MSYHLLHQKKAITFASIKVRIGSTPSTLPKPFVAPKKIPIPKVIFGLVGHNYGATTKSTPILPPLVCSSLSCVLDLDVDIEWACALSESKGGITKCGIICQ